MRRAWGVMALLVLAACGANRESADVEPMAATGPVSVVAENRRTDDVVVSLVRDGLRQRLGLVPAQTTGDFQIPWSQVSNGGRVRLIATPIAGRRSFVSESLVLRPGSEVNLSLTPLLGQSFVRVY
ncbi:MAG TPA: hypothetical protein VHJ69_00325 [Gemmatimonadales bacterium]|nr:hypothetical protein [Gemmatimonadales bacterium]